MAGRHSTLVLFVFVWKKERMDLIPVDIVSLQSQFIYLSSPQNMRRPAFNSHVITVLFENGSVYSSYLNGPEKSYQSSHNF